MKPKASCYSCQAEGKEGPAHRVGRQGRYFCAAHYADCVKDLLKENRQRASQHAVDGYFAGNR